jgi:hypothetical protein
VETKLTLRLDETTIQRAKRFARENQTSLSDMVEDYFNRITKPKKNAGGIAPIIRELSGISKTRKAKTNYREEIADYIVKKHK